MQCPPEQFYFTSNSLYYMSPIVLIVKLHRQKNSSESSPYCEVALHWMFEKQAVSWYMLIKRKELCAEQFLIILYLKWL